MVYSVESYSKDWIRIKRIDQLNGSAVSLVARSSVVEMCITSIGSCYMGGKAGDILGENGPESINYATSR